MGYTVLIVVDGELARIVAADVQDETVARAPDAAFEPVTGDGLRGFVSGAALRLKAAQA